MVYYVYLIKTLDGYKNKSYVGYTNNMIYNVLTTLREKINAPTRRKK